MSIADKLKTVAQKMEDVYRTGLFKYAPKSTASGKMVLLENSAPEPFVDMVVHGKSWQKTTEGNQLLDFTSGDFRSCELLDKKTGTVRLNYGVGDYYSTIAISSGFLIDAVLNNLGSTFTFALDSTIPSDYRIGIVIWGIRQNGSTHQEVTSILGSNMVSITVTDFNSIDGIDFRIGAYDGTSSDTTTVINGIRFYIGTEEKPFEPYTHGATPNSYFPQPIEYANEVKVLGGNYFNINNFVNQDDGVTIQDNGFAITNTQGEGHPNYIYTVTLGQLCPELKAGDEVYLNFEVVNSGGIEEFYLHSSCRDWINGTSLVITQADLDGNFNVYGSYGTTTIYKNIVVSKEPIPFEPYKEPQTLNLPTLRGIGEHRDYVDYVNKKHVREYAEYVFTGEEDFDDLIESYDAITTRFPHKSSSPFLCTHAITDDTRGSYWANDNNLAFCSSAFGVTSVEEFKNLLREKYNSNIPCKIVYQVAEPIETDLTDDQIYAFKRMRANSPNTTIIGQGQVDVTFIMKTE